VVRIAVEHRESIASAPKYERLAGRFFGEPHPADPHTTIVNDIRLAPRNPCGKVEYSAAFTLLPPLGKPSGIMFYKVPNRGNSPLNARLPADSIGSGNLLLSRGWQGDLAPRAGLETILLPVARNADGPSITGLVPALGALNFLLHDRPAHKARPSSPSFYGSQSMQISRKR
jgi:hypothetical protein